MQMECDAVITQESTEDEGGWQGYDDIEIYNIGEGHYGKGIGGEKGDEAIATSAESVRTLRGNARRKNSAKEADQRSPA